jgi:hypothetical protein
MRRGADAEARGGRRNLRATHGRFPINERGAWRRPLDRMADGRNTRHGNGTEPIMIGHGPPSGDRIWSRRDLERGRIEHRLKRRDSWGVRSEAGDRGKGARRRTEPIRKFKALGPRRTGERWERRNLIAERLDVLRLLAPALLIREWIRDHVSTCRLLNFDR